MKTKICTKCGINKALKEYYMHTSAKDGKHSECKSCTNVLQKKYYVEHKQRITDYQNKYRNDKRI